MARKEEISLIVSSLQSKVEKLVLQHRKAVEEIKQLKQDNDFLKKQLTEKKTKIVDLEQRNKALKLARSLGDKNQRNTDLKLKINELVKEIDKCIALVNN